MTSEVHFWTRVLLNKNWIKLMKMYEIDKFRKRSEYVYGQKVDIFVKKAGRRPQVSEVHFWTWIWQAGEDPGWVAFHYNFVSA